MDPLFVRVTYVRRILNYILFFLNRSMSLYFFHYKTVETLSASNM